MSWYRTGGLGRSRTLDGSGGVSFRYTRVVSSSRTSARRLEAASVIVMTFHEQGPCHPPVPGEFTSSRRPTREYPPEGRLSSWPLRNPCRSEDGERPGEERSNGAGLPRSRSPSASGEGRTDH